MKNDLLCMVAAGISVAVVLVIVYLGGYQDGQTDYINGKIAYEYVTNQVVTIRAK